MFQQLPDIFSPYNEMSSSLEVRLLKSTIVSINNKLATKANQKDIDEIVYTINSVINLIIEKQKLSQHSPFNEINNNNQLLLYLNSLSSPSSSSSFHESKLMDPIGTPLNQSTSSTASTTITTPMRKLKARTEQNDPIDGKNSGNQGIIIGGGRRKNRRGSCMECVFCKNNGQPASFYQNHVLKDVLGRVTCPILSSYDCPICHNGGGPKAHTVRYCPQNKPVNRLKTLIESQNINKNHQFIM